MDIDALLNAEPSSQKLIAYIARVALGERNPPLKYLKYFTALNQALWDEPPPFGTKLYSDIFCKASKDGQWLAISLIKNAERTGESARHLWSYAECVSDKKEKQLLKHLAVNESNHVLFILTALNIAFPDAITPAFRKELEQLSPHYSMGQELSAVDSLPYASVPSIDYYVQMNITELRTAIYQIMQRPILIKYSPIDHIPCLTKILDTLQHDKLNHIAYTATLIEHKSANTAQNDLLTIFRKCLRDFLRKTSEETVDFNYNLRFGNYP